MENRMPIYVVIIAIASIVGLEFYALSKGINGKGLALSIACISGLVGFNVGRYILRR